MSKLTDLNCNTKLQNNQTNLETIKDKCLPGYIIHFLTSNIKGQKWEDEAGLSSEWIERYTLGDETEQLVETIFRNIFSLGVITSERLSLCDVEGVDVILPELNLVFQVKSSSSGIKTFRSKDYTLKKYIIPIQVHPHDVNSKRALYFHLKDLLQPIKVYPNKLALKVERLKFKQIYSPKLIKLSQLIGFHDAEGKPYQSDKSDHRDKQSKEYTLKSSSTFKVAKIISTSKGLLKIRS